ncbi:MAG: T9SS type A sorting domain-containing protein [Bacteroidia bacterium]
MRFAAGNQFYHSGKGAATLDATYSLDTSNNYLIFTLDLRNYKTAPLELSFWYMHHNDEFHIQDRVWIRGSNTDNWIVAYNWGKEKAAPCKWKFASGLKINDLLKANGQVLDSTFQLRFGQRDKDNAKSTQLLDGLTIDDIKIIERKNLDGVITEFGVFCDGPSNTSAKLLNEGNDTIKTIDLSWKLNGTWQNAQHFNVLLAPGNSTYLTLDSSIFNKGLNLAEIVVDSVNGQLDQNLDDTTKSQLWSSFNGTYTIGGTSADFEYLQDAIKLLNTYGVCGPTKFIINPGVYEGNFVISNIPGCNAINTVTFEGTDSSQCIIRHLESYREKRLLVLNGTRFITLRKLKFESTDANNAWLIQLKDQCLSVSIENCVFGLKPSKSTTALHSMVALDANSVYSAGELLLKHSFNFKYLKISNNIFSGGNRHLYVAGDSSKSTNPSTLIVNNNTFKKITSSTSATDVKLSLSINYIDSFVFSNNYVETPMFIYKSGYFKINNNHFIVDFIFEWVLQFSYVENTDVLAIQDCDFGSSNSTIHNNYFNHIGYESADFSNYYNSHASLRISSSKNILVAHNTFIGRRLLAVEDRRAHWTYVSNYETSNIQVLNNLIYETKKYDYDNGISTYISLKDLSSLLFDHNIIFSVDKNLIDINGEKYSTIKNQLTDYSKINSNSWQLKPRLDSITGPHLDYKFKAFQAPSVGIDTDIDGELRCESYPTIGADESKFNQSKPKSRFTLIGLQSIDSTIVAYNNANPKAFNTYEWYLNGALADSVSFNFQPVFDTAGRYRVTLKTSNCSKFDTTSKFVNVYEKYLKTFELKGNLKDTIHVFSTFVDSGIALSNYKGDTTGLKLNTSGTYIDSFGLNSTATRLGLYTIKYKVTYTTGSDSLVRYILVNDTLPPLVTVLGADTIFLNQGDTFIDPGFIFVDNYWDSANVWGYTFNPVNTQLPDTYSVQYYAADSSRNVSDTFNRIVVVYPIVGINNNQQSDISIYPTPTSSHVFIRATGQIPFESVYLYDMQGRKVGFEMHQNSPNTYSINFEQIPSGIYVIKLTNSSGNHQFMIVKE